jgi:cell division septum initiation protein DivIVA
LTIRRRSLAASAVDRPSPGCHHHVTITGGGPVVDQAAAMTLIMNDRHDFVRADASADASADVAFPLVRHGYAPDAVHTHLASTADEIDRLTAANRVLLDQVRQLQASAVAAGRDVVHLAARRADADREIERYLDAGRREAAETVLRARREAADIIAHAQAQGAAPTAAELDAASDQLEHRRSVIAESLTALHRVIGATLHELTAEGEPDEG